MCPSANAAAEPMSIGTLKVNDATLARSASIGAQHGDATSVSDAPVKNAVEPDAGASRRHEWGVSLSAWASAAAPKHAASAAYVIDDQAPRKRSNESVDAIAAYPAHVPTAKDPSRRNEAARVPPDVKPTMATKRGAAQGPTAVIAPAAPANSGVHAEPPDAAVTVSATKSIGVTVP